MHEIGRVVWKLKAANVRCADGVTRTAFLRSYWDGQRFCSYPDTYLTVPAFVRVKGCAVRGYVTNDDDVMYFRASKRSKHAHLVEPSKE